MTDPNGSLTTAPARYAYDDIFSRNIGNLTPDAQSLLRRSCVAVAGVGGAGASSVELLTRLGVGHIKIADFDTYEVHNLNRQLGALHSTLGRQKSQVTAERMRDINPHLDLEVFAEGITTENAARFVDRADVIVDAVDYHSPGARLALHRQARAQGLHLLLPPGVGFGAMVVCFAPEGPTIEEVFGFPADSTQIAAFKMDLRKIIGCDLPYLPQTFFETTRGAEPYISSNPIANFMAGAIVATQVIAVLMMRARRLKPNAFSEYGPIRIVTAPRAVRLDAWTLGCCVEVDITSL